MAIPPITPAQAISLGIAAQTVGSAAASTFAELLHGATELLSGLVPAEASPAAGQSCGTPAPAETDAGVLQRQIGELLDAFHSAFRKLLSAVKQSIPASGTTITGGEAGLQIAGGPQGVEGALNADGRLPALFRAIAARTKLLQAATGGAVPAGIAIRLTPADAVAVPN